MDFITDLPPSARRGLVFDSILVAVDRYTKYTRYIPSRKDWDAVELADSLVDDVFTKFGIPDSIVTDRGSLFTSHYWSTFCYHLAADLHYSTAFHPQTDGQTERQNQTLEQYLRSYVNYQQDDWTQWLSVAEYAYNNSVHSATGAAPFWLMFSENPKWKDTIEDGLESEVPASKQRADGVLKMKKLLEETWKKTCLSQRKSYNAKHTPKSYCVGDMVYLNAKNIKSTRPSKKLDYKYYGPYEVEKPIGKQAYRLRLPDTMAIHNVFHVSLLEPAKGRLGDDLQPPPINVDGEDQWEIDAILDSRIHYRKLQYKVRWLGFNDTEDRWLDASDLDNAKELVAEFHAKYPDLPKESGPARKRRRKASMK